jgi:hypothetical protein
MSLRCTDSSPEIHILTGESTTWADTNASPMAAIKLQSSTILALSDKWQHNIGLNTAVSISEPNIMPSLPETNRPGSDVLSLWVLVN